MVRHGHGQRTLVVAMVAAGALLAGPTAATALSCARHPLASPQAIAVGAERLSVDGSFRDHYDGAIFGTVRGMQTQEDGQRPDYGRTEVVVEVTGAYGPGVGERVVVVEDDPGWLRGHAFEVGTHYFIPYVRTPAGLHSAVCDPITEVDPADVPGLVAAAQQGAWPPATADDDAPADATVDAAVDANPSMPLGAIAVATSLVGVTALLRGARSRPHPPDPSAQRQPTSSSR